MSRNRIILQYALYRQGKHTLLKMNQHFQKNHTDSECVMFWLFSVDTWMVLCSLNTPPHFQPSIHVFSVTNKMESMTSKTWRSQTPDPIYFPPCLVSAQCWKKITILKFVDFNYSFLLNVGAFILLKKTPMKWYLIPTKFPRMLKSKTTEKKY